MPTTDPTPFDPDAIIAAVKAAVPLPPTQDRHLDAEGKPITGATWLNHEHTIDEVRAIVAGAGTWAEQVPGLVGHVAMTNSWALASVLGMLLAENPTLALRAAVLTEGILIDGGAEHVDDLDPEAVEEQAAVWAKYAPIFARAPRSPGASGPVDLAALVAQGCGDPGSVLPRDVGEPTALWSGRAVMQLLAQRGVITSVHDLVAQATADHQAGA